MRFLQTVPRSCVGMEEEEDDDDGAEEGRMLLRYRKRSQRGGGRPRRSGRNQPEGADDASHQPHKLEKGKVEEEEDQAMMDIDHGKYGDSQVAVDAEATASFPQDEDLDDAEDHRRGLPQEEEEGEAKVAVSIKPPSAGSTSSSDSSQESDDGDYFLSPTLTTILLPPISGNGTDPLTISSTLSTTAPSNAPVARILQPTTALLRKSQQDLQRDLAAIDADISRTNVAAKEQLNRLLQEELDLLHQEKHPKLVRRAERASGRLKRRMRVSERRRDYQVQSVLNAYECTRQQIDLSYQAALRELRSQYQSMAFSTLSMNRLDEKYEPPPPAAAISSSATNAGEEDLYEIEARMAMLDEGGGEEGNGSTLSPPDDAASFSLTSMGEPITS